MPKDVKLSILNIVEGSNLKKSFLIQKLNITPIKYYRWAQKYYLDNCLDDKRGGYRIKQTRLEDLYRTQTCDIRKNKFLGKAIIGPERISDALEEADIYISHETIRKILNQEGIIIPRPRVEVNVVPKDVLTDRGTQFFCGPGKKKGAFALYLKNLGINHILARVRHPQTMGKIERYHRSLRQECLNHFEFDDPIVARQELRAYVYAYNTIREHKGIRRVTPHSRDSCDDKLIEFNRLKLRNQIKLERSLRFDDPQLDSLVAV